MAGWHQGEKTFFSSVGWETKPDSLPAIRGKNSACGAAGRKYPPSAARVVPVVNLAQTLAQNVRVYLRGGNVGVAEHHLQAAQVGAALEQVRGETVAQHVRREPLAYPAREP